MEINNTEENDAALKVIRLLMDADPERNSDEGVTLRTLALAVQEYEKKFGPDSVNE